MVQAFQEGAEDDGAPRGSSSPFEAAAAGANVMDVEEGNDAEEPTGADGAPEDDGSGDGDEVEPRYEPRYEGQGGPTATASAMAVAATDPSSSSGGGQYQQQARQHPLLQPQAAVAPVYDENDLHARHQQQQKGIEGGLLVFREGMKLDVRDTVGRWCEAQVTAVDAQRQTLSISYLYWADRYDEAGLSWGSDRLAPFQSQTFTGAWTTLRQGQRVEAWEAAPPPGDGRWVEAFVVDVREEAGEGGGEAQTGPAAVKIHVKQLKNRPLVQDVWVSREEGAARLRPFGRQKPNLAKKRINGGTGTAAAAETAAATTAAPVRPRGVLQPMLASTGLGARGASGGHSNYNQQHRAQVTAQWGQEQTQHHRAIVAMSDRYNEYSAALARHARMGIQPIEGDGNCLFRTVSHQMYGTEAHHLLIRERCMDYMEVEKQYFEPYVVGDMAAFLRYLEVKRRAGVWGDDPEVQALCELYDRPAEIWAYDAQTGAKKLRTFHEASGLTPQGAARAPMRLSYYGGGHYDSLVPLPGLAGSGGRPPLLAEAPGVVEARAIEMARQRQLAVGAGGGAAARRSDEEATEAEAVAAALRLSRQEFDSREDLETALEVSAQQHIQEELLRSVVAQSEEEDLRRAMEDSIKASEGLSVEEELLRQAMQESMMATATAAAASAAGGGGAEKDNGGGKLGPGEEAAAGGGGGGKEDDEEAEVRRALQLSAAEEERQLQEALRLSQQLLPEQQQLAGGSAMLLGGEEDPELAAAIALSLSSAAQAAPSTTAGMPPAPAPSSSAAAAAGDAYVLQQAATLEAARLRKEEEDLKRALNASLGRDN